MKYIKCKFIIYFLFLTVLVKAENFIDLYKMVKSIVSYYRCVSVIFITSDHNRSYDFFKLQKMFSSEENLFSSTVSLKMFQKVYELGYHGGKKTVVVSDSDNILNPTFMKLTNKIDMSSYKWLIIVQTLTLKSFEGLKIPIFCDFIVAQKILPTGFDLSELYEVEPNRKLLNHLGEWSYVSQETLENKLQISSRPIFQRRKNLQGAIINVVSPYEDPCTKTSVQESIATLAWCIHKRLWDLIAEMLNATTKTHIDQNLDLDTIRNSDAELTFRSAPINSFDLNTRSYLWPTFRTEVQVYVSYVGQAFEWQTYIRPFNSKMWLAILIWILLCDFVTVIANYINDNSKGKSFIKQYRKYSFLSFFAFCNQGVSDIPVASSYKIIFFFMYVVPAVLLPGYSAVLTSFLTIQRPTMPFQNLEELSRNPEYHLGWHQSLPLKNLFNVNDTDPINQALLENNVLPQKELPVTDVEGIERMCTGKFVYLSQDVTVWALKPKCKYFVFKQHFKTIFTSMELKKNSSYKFFFNRCTRTINYSGILWRIEMQTTRKFFTLSELQKVPVKTETIYPIMLENSILPFAILFFGLSTANIIFIFEYLCFRPKSFRSV